MAPNILSNTLLLADAIIEEKTTYSSEKKTTKSENLNVRQPVKKWPNTQQQRKPYFSSDIVWKNVIIFFVLHLSAFYGLYLLVIGEAKLLTFIVSYTYGMLGGMGITAGAHRLWAHKAYKATWQLKLILTVGNLIAFQNCIYEWVRDHRVHHKFTDTDADPHNSRRGFFFSHMGWLLLKKHPDIKRKGATIDMSDLEQDAIVMFQKKYYGYLMPLFCFIIPTLIPYFLLNESFWYSWYVAAAFRYTLTLHATWLVNSAAHIWGTRPYDKTIAPANNTFVAVAAFGEGWHNYHHVFPWDYKTAELGDYSMNFSTAFIDFFAKIGWAYDLKTVSEELIRKRAARTGDGSTKYSKCIVPKINAIVIDENNNTSKLIEPHDDHHSHDDNLVWGWDDKDMDIDDKNNALIINRFKK